MTASLASRPAPPPPPAIRRLNALAALDADAVAALRTAIGRARPVKANHEVVAEGQPVSETVLFLEGWAARVRHMADGRRAIMNFLLPGDLIGLCDQDKPLASSTVVALTHLTVCAAPERGVSASLDRAYLFSKALEEAHLLAQIARLSRFNAHERLADLMLELLERLELAGLASRGVFGFPLTQETVGDAVGLSTVHVNRTLQQARKAGDLIWTNQKVQIAEPEMLRRNIGRQRVRVTACMAG